MARRGCPRATRRRQRLGRPIRLAEEPTLGVRREAQGRGQICGGRSHAASIPKRATWRIIARRASPPRRAGGGQPPGPRRGEAPRPAGTRGFSVASRKPDPVVGSHPSWPSVAGRLVRPKPGSLGRATLKRSPIWPCTGRGLPSRPVTRTAGELLPHRFTLARTSEEAAGGLLSVALSLGFPRLAVSQRPALWCPDFPRRVPHELLRDTRRGPAAATWLAPRVYLIAAASVSARVRATVFRRRPLAGT